MENLSPVPDNFVSGNTPNEVSSPNGVKDVVRLQTSNGSGASSKHQRNMNDQKDNDEDEEQQLSIQEHNIDDAGQPGSMEAMSPGFYHDMFTVDWEDEYESVVLTSWPVMKSGRFQWNVEFYNEDSAQSSACAVGITTLADANNDEDEEGSDHGVFIGNDLPGWSFSNDGMLWCQGRCKPTTQCFGYGDRVMFLLDLTTTSNDNTHNGALYASVNGKRPILVATNLIPYAQAKGGFVPAASLFGGTVIHEDYMEV